ncbi:4-(cytidine 5'-diphospho)-2-C-methyl-D-erythritol kinase [Agromyces aerolatus]|uniref:4-(cytidine 5'-diphospho)-2-C-methyl-D-erythritol kinase n=1 Tax=Agromyces sp. LY-1074 TaxID=3074080 RepID=UPI002864D786|nr:MULTISPECIES: 4-(cytidine 5'-diphospho)-2-C-methyl-D-erythritol kinase [unclassified Agromyces]MDR5698806.1 4-(cytidine 5'-diphospho)-2-C-methyl-D-erythritol kinase [Agromyces sp. LY-1074]MDR5705416.1 4-(cytidine 5'-diphospho)-2-C-methyl-D-erythritol kinase [Agromyces sp. LY-1358]
MTFLPAEESVHVRAPGKVNLFLRVGDAGADGYHDVATAYQAVSLYEDVFARPDDRISVSFTGPMDTSQLPTGSTNLAMKAAKLFARTTGVTAGIRLEIEKHVPIAGGMGGGSADAAATLLACDALWGTDLPRDAMLRMAAKLGADVPFALMGGTAIGTGRGDRLSPALGTGRFHWVLAVADFGLSTPEVYRQLDVMRAERATRASGSTRATASADGAGSAVPTVDATVLHALRAGDAARLATALDNDLQAAALRLAPGLADLIDLGEQSGALTGIVSGSGPTVAFLTEDSDSAIALQISLSAARVTALHVHGPVHGARVMVP